MKSLTLLVTLHSIDDKGGFIERRVESSCPADRTKLAPNIVRVARLQSKLSSERATAPVSAATTQ